MVVPGSQTRRFLSTAEDSKYSRALYPRIQDTESPKKKKRSHLHYFDPDPNPDCEDACRNLAASEASTIDESKTSSSATDSYAYVSPSISPSNGRRRSTRYSSLLGEAGKDVEEGRTVKDALHPQSRKQASQLDNANDRVGTTDEQGSFNSRGNASPSTRLTLIAELQVDEQKSRGTIDATHAKSLTICDEIQDPCDQATPLVLMLCHKFVDIDRNVFAEEGVLKPKTFPRKHVANVPKDSQNISIPRDVLPGGHVTAAPRELCSARELENRVQFPGSASLLITFTGSTNEEVEVSLPSPNTLTINTDPPHKGRVDDPAATLTTALKRLSTRIQSPTKAPDSQETAVSKPPFLNAWIHVEAETHPFDELLYFDSAQRLSPSKKRESQVRSGLRNVDATAEMEEVEIEIEVMIPAGNEVERKCERDPVIEPDVPPSATKYRIAKEDTTYTIQETTFFLLGSEDRSKKEFSTPDKSSSGQAVSLWVVESRETGCHVTGTSLSRTDKELLLADGSSPSETLSSPSCHQLRASVVFPAYPNHETTPPTLTPTPIREISGYANLRAGAFSVNKREARNRAESKASIPVGFLPKAVNPVAEELRSSSSPLFRAVEDEVSTDRQTLSANACDYTVLPPPSRTIIEMTTSVSCQVPKMTNDDHFVSNLAKSQRIQIRETTATSLRLLGPEPAVSSGALSSLDNSRKRNTENYCVATMDVKERIRRRQAMAVKKHVSAIRTTRETAKLDPLKVKQSRPRGQTMVCHGSNGEKQTPPTPSVHPIALSVSASKAPMLSPIIGMPRPLTTATPRRQGENEEVKRNADVQARARVHQSHLSASTATDGMKSVNQKRSANPSDTSTKRKPLKKCRRQGCKI